MITNEREQELAQKIQAFEEKYGVKIDPKLLSTASKELALSDPVTWGMKYRALRGEPYRFELPLPLRSEDPENENYKIRNRHRPFLKQMIADQAQNKCYEKSRQCGASESSVTEVLWFLATHKATKAMYTFPSNQQMQDFSNSRVAAALDETDYMKALIAGSSVNNVGMKKLNNASFLFMRSAQNSRLGEGVDADALFVDEKDRMPDKIEAAFEQSLSSSSYKLLREFSTPTLPGVGVDKSFQASCKYRWFVKCDSGHIQTLVFEQPSSGRGNIGQNFDVDPTAEVVIPGTYYYKCSHIGANGVGCVSKINRWNGEWVAEYDDHRKKTHAGYHINQLSCSWLSADDIMQQKLKYKFEDIFYNYVLGEPYASNAGLITREALESFRDRTRWMPRTRKVEYRTIVAGIDWGHFNWLVVLGLRFDGKIDVVDFKWFLDDADTFLVSKAIGEYLEPYKPNMIVADLGYGRDRTADLLQRFPDRVFACTYTSGKFSDKTFNPVWSDATFRVSVNRTAHIRNALQMIKLGKVRFPSHDDGDYTQLFDHIMNLALIHIEEQNPDTNELEIVETIKNKGPDHGAHSFSYACLALEKLTAGGDFSWRFF